MAEGAAHPFRKMSAAPRVSVMVSFLIEMSLEDFERLGRVIDVIPILEPSPLP